MPITMICIKCKEQINVEDLIRQLDGTYICFLCLEEEQEQAKSKGVTITNLSKPKWRFWKCTHKRNKSVH